MSEEEKGSKSTDVQVGEEGKWDEQNPDVGSEGVKPEGDPGQASASPDESEGDEENAPHIKDEPNQ